MKVVTVPAEQKFLSDLLMEIREEGLILQTTYGQQFVLLSLEGWRGFDVGDSDDFEQKVKATAANKTLMAFLAERRSAEQRIPMADIKRQLGLS